MDWALYRQIVREMAQIGTEHGFRPQMTYCYMAEPFMADHLERYVKYAQDCGIDVYLNTNAAVMTPEKINALLDGDFAGKFHISVHGITPKVYERIMGLDYRTSLNNILYLLDHYDHARVCIRGVDDGWPQGEKQRWFDFWQKHGVQLEYLAPISRCGGVARLIPQQSADKPGVRLYGCREHHPLLEMVILFDGRAVMCCQDMGREIIWGNVAKDGIRGVWHGKVRQKMIQKLYTGQISTKSFLCARCEQALGPGAMVQSLFHEAWQKIKRKSPLTSAAAV